MIDVAAAIDAEARPLTLIQTPAGAYDDGGNWIEGEEQETPFMGAIFAVSSRDLRDMPEGIRTEAKRTLWTRQPVQNNDRIGLGETRYKVLMVHDRSFEGGFYKGVLGLLNDK